jgi:hypothetical protein
MRALNRVVCTFFVVLAFCVAAWWAAWPFRPGPAARATTIARLHPAQNYWFIQWSPAWAPMGLEFQMTISLA